MWTKTLSRHTPISVLNFDFYGNNTFLLYNAEKISVWNVEYISQPQSSCCIRNALELLLQIETWMNDIWRRVFKLYTWRSVGVRNKYFRSSITRRFIYMLLYRNDFSCMKIAMTEWLGCKVLFTIVRTPISMCKCRVHSNCFQSRIVIGKIIESSQLLLTHLLLLQKLQRRFPVLVLIRIHLFVWLTKSEFIE